MSETGMRGERVLQSATRESGVPGGKVSGRIPELDGLRGIAIGSVLVWHYFAMIIQATPGTPLAYTLVSGRLLWSGVDLFFVLSGFLIGGILLDARKATNYFQVFYRRRFFRIVPIYAVLLLVFLAQVSVARWIYHTDGGWLVQDAKPWYSYWTFTQNFWMAASGTLGAAALAMTWSLAIEEQFYLSLPLIVRFFEGRWLTALVLTGICVAPLARILVRLVSPENWIAVFVLMPCRADALLLGMLGAILLRNDKWRARIERNNLFFAIAMPVLLAGIALLTWKSPRAGSPVMETFGLTWLALFYAFVLVYAVTRRSSLVSQFLRAKWLGWLGGLAYGLYLIHQTMLGLFFGSLWGGVPQITGVYTLLKAFAALVLTLVVARLSWRFFEQPLIRFGHQSNYHFAPPEPNELAPSAPELVRS